MKKAIVPANAPAAVGPYSSAVECGGVVYVSGQLPADPATGAFPEGIEAQTRQSLDNLKAAVEAAGLEMDDILKTTVLLSDISNFAAMNAVYAEYFKAPYPARAAFQVAALPKGALVEIEAVASR